MPSTAKPSTRPPPLIPTGTLLQRLHRALLWVLAGSLLIGLATVAAALLSGDPVKPALKSTTLLQPRMLLRTSGSDSWAAMWSGRFRQAEHAGSPYERTLALDNCKYQYPPSSLLVLELLPPPSALPFACAQREPPEVDAWTVVWSAKVWIDIASALAVLGLVLVSARLLMRTGAAANTLVFGPGQRRQAFAMLMLAGAAGLIFYPAMRAHQLGQVQVFLNLALGFAVLLVRTRPGTAGALVGLCCLFKPQYALFLLWALLRRDWRFLAGVALAFGSGLALALWLYGLQAHLQYLAYLKGLAQVGEAFWPNQTVNGLLNRLLLTGDPVHWTSAAFPSYHPVVRWGTFVSSLAIMGAALFMGRRAAAQRDAALDFGAMLAALTLASPIGWEHHYGSFLPLFALMLARLARDAAPNRPAWGLLGLAYLLMANAVLRPEWLFKTPLLGLLGSHLFVGAMLLFGLLLAWRGRAGGPSSRQQPSARGSLRSSAWPLSSRAQGLV